MLRLNRTTEYALMALRNIAGASRSAKRTATAREIADAYGLPFEITAKTLRRLKDSGYIESIQGAQGGYAMACDPAQVTLADFVSKFEGCDSLVQCATETADVTGDASCDLAARCEIKHIMIDLSDRILGFLRTIRLSEITDEAPRIALPSYSPRYAQSFEAAFGEEP